MNFFFAICFEQSTNFVSLQLTFKFMAYDVFISYRRKGAGAGVAGELQTKLESRGFKVFLDVDEIGSGQFPIQIDRAIEECMDFLLVLSPGTLDRCNEKDDWVRREIATAENLGKNVVGIMLPGFVMPEAETLPEPLQKLPSKQVFLWSHEYRNASFDKILQNLVSSGMKKKKNHKNMLIILLCAVVLLVSLFLLTRPTYSDPNVIKTQDETPIETQGVDVALLFNDHVNKAIELSQNLPDAATFRENLEYFVETKQLFQRLMESISECDTAIMLMNENADLVKDTCDINVKRERLIGIRSDYMDIIIEDIGFCISNSADDFARQDMEIARILSFTSAEKHVLDSLDRIINK